MRKIHITEEQLNCLKKKLSEQDSYNIDVTKNIEDAGGNAKTAISNLSSSNPQQSADLKSGKATATFNADAVTMEGKLYTKKQIKEAKLEKLKKSCKVIKKKDI